MDVRENLERIQKKRESLILVSEVGIANSENRAEFEKLRRRRREIYEGLVKLTKEYNREELLWDEALFIYKEFMEEQKEIATEYNKININYKPIFDYWKANHRKH